MLMKFDGCQYSCLQRHPPLRTHAKKFAFQIHCMKALVGLTVPPTYQEPLRLQTVSVLVMSDVSRNQG